MSLSSCFSLLLFPLMTTPGAHLLLASSFRGLICSSSLFVLSCNALQNPECCLLFLHQLLFGSTAPSLHPVACDGTCWTNCIPAPPSIQLPTRFDMEKTCQLVWLFPACTCEVGGCVGMRLGFVCVRCCGVSLFPMMFSSNHRGRSGFTSLPVSTWNKPQ